MRRLKEISKKVERKTKKISDHAQTAYSKAILLYAQRDEGKEILADVDEKMQALKKQAIASPDSIAVTTLMGQIEVIHGEMHKQY